MVETRNRRRLQERERHNRNETRRVKRRKENYSNGQKYRMLEVVQQVDKIDFDNMKKTLQVKEKIKAIEKWAYIKHDKDVKENNEPVEPHYHIIMKFNYPYRLGSIANWFIVPENCVEKIKGGWVNACRYLTHKNAKDKYQYKDKEVVANFDYIKECNIEQLEKRSFKHYKSLPTDVKEKFDKIRTGDCTLKNIHEHFTDLEYAEYKKKIIDVMEYYEIVKQANFEEMKKGIENIFVYGESGLGKTRYAKMYCKKKHNEYFLTGSSNDPLDGYKGEKAIIFDDIRPEDVLFSDYLRLTDPYNVSLFKSRYKNKFVQAETQMFTTPLSPTTYASKLKKDNQENLKQFFRRHNAYVKILKNYFEFYAYDEESNDLRFVETERNFFNSSSLTQPERKLNIADEVIELTRQLRIEAEENILGEHNEPNNMNFSTSSKDIYDNCFHLPPYI